MNGASWRNNVSTVKRLNGVVDRFASHLAALVTPGEVRNGNNEEAVNVSICLYIEKDRA
jgi:hypothetical protein